MLNDAWESYHASCFYDVTHICHLLLRIRITAAQALTSIELDHGHSTWILNLVINYVTLHDKALNIFNFPHCYSTMPTFIRILQFLVSQAGCILFALQSAAYKLLVIQIIIISENTQHYTHAHTNNYFGLLSSLSETFSKSVNIRSEIVNKKL